MAAFDYIALTGGGDRRQGLEEADSERQVRRILREQGLIPLEVRRARAERSGNRRRLSAGARLSGDEVVLFTRLLGTLLNSGLPLDDALTALSNQTESTNFRRVALEVRAKLLEGHPLERALAEFPRAFPRAYRATVGAGEQTRYLPLVLNRLADYLEQRRQLRQKLSLALLYPSILSVVSLLVLAGLLGYVVPEVVIVFDQMKRELPLITRILIVTSDTFRDWGIHIAAGAGILALSAWRWFREPAVRRLADRAALRLPVMRPLVIEIDAANFARTLAILLESGLEMIEALKISSRAISNSLTRAEFDAVVTRVREGSSLANALGACTTVPKLLVHLVGNGEASGELTRMLEAAADAHESSVQRRIAVLVGLVEPLMILLMGGLVLLIVLAILLPIFDMNQLV